MQPNLMHVYTEVSPHLFSMVSLVNICRVLFLKGHQTNAVAAASQETILKRQCQEYQVFATKINCFA